MPPSFRRASVRPWWRGFRNAPSVDPPEAVISVAISGGRMPQPQRLRRADRAGWLWLTAPGEDIDDHVGGVDALTQRFEASRLDRWQSVAQHRGEDLDHLTVAVDCPLQLAADPLQTGGQDS